MRKAFKDKFSGTKKLVRRVLSKPSIESHATSEVVEERMDQELLLKTELDALKDQVSNLKAAIQTLQNESEQKEVSIAKLARDKEKITLDLLKTRRSNTALARQLEEERKFYFKEKEIYCHEMNECKKIKKLFSSSSVGQNERTIEECKNEITKLKETLNQTLEANYNLSIKFLRMKNTKTCLKTELQTMKLEHEKLGNEYKSKIENLTAELSDLINEKLTDSLSPSSKKYLQLVKQNSCLVYENLCLQLEVDNLNFKIEKVQLNKTKSSTNEHLMYIHHKNESKNPIKRREFRVPIQNETPEKLEKEPQPCCSKSQVDEYETVKIFERQRSPGVPTIEIMNEAKKRDKKSKKKKKHEEIVKQEIVNCKLSDKNTSIQNIQTLKTNMDIIPDYRIEVDDKYKEKIANHNLSKLALFQVSNVTSSTSTNEFSSPRLKRTYSSPEIVQSTNFRKC